MTEALAARADPFVVMAKPTGPLCNFDCTYCYYLAKTELFDPGERYRMADEVLEAYVRRFIEASPGPVVHFVWHGGEPTLAGLELYRKAVAFQGRHLPAGWTALNNIQTNGSLLDEQWCRFLSEHRFAVGLSIDGPARTHDALRPDRRGRPTHERVMRGLHLLRAQGIEPDVLCTLNARTAREPLEVYRFFLREGVRWLQFLPVVQRDPAGRVSAATVSPEAMGELLCTIFDEWVRYDVGKIGIQNFLECLLVVTGKPANLCIMAETCGNVPALEHDGGVYSCDHFVDADHYLGTVMDSPLGSFLDAPAQRAFGDAKRDSLPSCCRTCEVRFLCNGGCPKDRFAVAPDGEPGLNYLCAGYRRFYGHVRPYMERMASHIRAGRGAAAIMGELATEERDERERWSRASRNDPCPCGSGRKYKSCCLSIRRS